MFDLEVIALAVLGVGSLSLFIAIFIRERRFRRMERHAMKMCDGRRPQG